MTEGRLVRASKFLSKHLRHQSERIGLTLAPGGWVVASELLQACAAHGHPLSRAELEEVVARNSKQRFALDETGMRVRANQGHSVDVDLGLEPVSPPDALFHGTGHRSVEAIRQEGLHRMSRHHVHLSPDLETARQVGARHGRPVVFRVDAGAMHRAGHVFYCSANGVWLVDHVPPEFLREGGDANASGNAVGSQTTC